MSIGHTALGLLIYRFFFSTGPAFCLTVSLKKEMVRRGKMWAIYRSLLAYLATGRKQRKGLQRDEEEPNETPVQLDRRNEVFLLKI